MCRLCGALLSALAVLLVGAVNPPIEIDVVFPRNDTYAVIEPFPLVFALRNIPARFPMDFLWTVTCQYATFSGTNNIDGLYLQQGHVEPLYVFNSTKFWYDGSVDYKQNKYGPLGDWEGDKDTCTLSWKYGAATCQLLSDGIGMITVPPDLPGNMTFYLHPGGKLPHDAMSAYDGCPIAGAAYVDNSTGICADAYVVTSDVNPCALDVKAVASSLAAALPAPTTTVTALPTTSTSTAASQVSSRRTFDYVRLLLTLTEIIYRLQRLGAPAATAEASRPVDWFRINGLSWELYLACYSSRVSIKKSPNVAHRKQ